MNAEHGNDLHAERADHYAAAPEARKGKMKGIMTVFFGVAVIAGGLGGAGYWFYNQGQPMQDDGKLPILLPDPSPIKLRPEDPGGMEVPHRNTTVYDQLSDVDPDADVVLQELPDMPRTPEVMPTTPKSPDADVTADVGAAASSQVDEATAKAETDSSTDVSDTSSDMTPPKITTPEPMSDAQKAIAAVDARTKEAAPAAAPAKTEQKAVTPPATGDYRIQLASLREESKASAEWKRLSSKNKDLLGSLQMFVQRTDLEDKGIYYRLQAGPLADAAAAEKLCNDLKQRNVGCLIVRP